MARRPGPTKSRYGSTCPVARTLAIIGERWTILILRDLMLAGPRKFQDFERSLAGISPNTLSARLKALEDHGIVARRFYADHPPRAEYLLTDKGQELRFVLKGLRDWGQKHTG
ncbi:MAG: helix-turn-helix transcriptional regulator [Proteobacteria bacterium]|nr:helix-turn-helix transcriptional regulator [Pseudomonadota bacterium]